MASINELVNQIYVRADELSNMELIYLHGSLSKVILHINSLLAERKGLQPSDTEE